MEKVGKAIVKLRIPILILSVLLLIPAGIGYVKTKVNYDILYYLPGDIDTMKGQDIMRAKKSSSLRIWVSGIMSYMKIMGLVSTKELKR